MNPDGSASAVSNRLGPLTAQPSTAGTTGGGSTTSSSGGSTGYGPTPSQITAAVVAIRYPSGRAGLKSVLKSGGVSASFDAPSAGNLYIVWTATIKVGKGKHRKRKTFTLVHENVNYTGAGVQPLTINLTKLGIALLREYPKLLIHGAYKFNPSPWHLPFTDVVDFTL
jgi:hypothetical protein